MNVLVASQVVGRRLASGVAARSVDVAHALRRHGAAVRLLGTGAGLTRADTDELRGLDAILLRAGPARFPLPLVAPARLAGLVDWADVVVLFSHWTALNAAVYATCRRRGVPYIVCPCGALPARGRSRMLKRVYDAAVGRRLVRDAAACVATTPLERQQLLATSAMPPRLVVIPNAVDVPDRAPPDAADAEATAAFRQTLAVDAAPIVLFIGRLNPLKGPDLLVEAFARVAPRFPVPRLVVVGPDEGMGRALAALAARLGIADRVRFSGGIDRDRAPAAYRAAALLVVPSRSEAMSLVAIEAGAVGTPVLLTEACGFAIGDAEGGLTVPATVEGLADGLARLLADLPALPRLGARLRHHVAAHYAWPVVGRRWFELCAEVTGRTEGALSA
jgi:glycosyltransferase involved in cell wall biosynthesis